MITYEQQQALVAQGLATVKTEGNFATFKYSRKVMYKNLWNTNPDLLYCRGHVYDKRNGNLVQNPPAKTFNYLENDNWKDVALDTKVLAYHKYNGFMAAATIYEDKLLVSTTGTTDSDYAKLAKSMLEKHLPSFHEAWHPMNMLTTVYEIVHPSDPHIVDEKEGVYVLGDNLKIPNDGFMPYNVSFSGTLGDILAKAKDEEHEGYMVYTTDRSKICKIKTPYYVFKKKLMRMSASNVELLYGRNLQLRHTPDIWWKIINIILDTQAKDEWIALRDQERRVVIERIYNAIK